MKKLLALTLTAMMSLAAVTISSNSANAQGFQLNPLSMGAGINAFAGTGEDVVNVRSRRWRRRNGAAGAIIGGIIAGAIIAEESRRYNRRPARRVYRGNRHENWCHRRFRSYRAWDNTYQPYNSRRRQCISPYY